MDHISQEFSKLKKRKSFSSKQVKVRYAYFILFYLIISLFMISCGKDRKSSFQSGKKLNPNKLGRVKEFTPHYSEPTFFYIGDNQKIVESKKVLTLVVDSLDQVDLKTYPNINQIIVLDKEKLKPTYSKRINLVLLKEKIFNGKNIKNNATFRKLLYYGNLNLVTPKTRLENFKICEDIWNRSISKEWSERLYLSGFTVKTNSSYRKTYDILRSNDSLSQTFTVFVIENDIVKTDGHMGYCTSNDF